MLLLSLQIEDNEMYRRHFGLLIEALSELVQYNETGVGVGGGLARHLFSHLLRSDGLSSLQVFTVSLQRFTVNEAARTQRWWKSRHHSVVSLVTTP